MARLKFADPTFGWLPMCDNWIGKVQYRDPGDGSFYPICEPRAYSATRVLQGAYDDVPVMPYSSLGTPVARWHNPATGTWDSLCCGSPQSLPWIVATRAFDVFPGDGTVGVPVPGNVIPGDMVIAHTGASPPGPGWTEVTALGVTLYYKRVGVEVSYPWPEHPSLTYGGQMVFLRDVPDGRAPTLLQGGTRGSFRGDRPQPWTLKAASAEFTPTTRYKYFLLGYLQSYLNTQPGNVAVRCPGEPTIAAALPAAWANHVSRFDKAHVFAAGYGGGLTPTTWALVTGTWTSGTSSSLTFTATLIRIQGT